jgi:hypothetical protein
LLDCSTAALQRRKDYWEFLDVALRPQIKQIDLKGVSMPISIPPDIRSHSAETIPPLDQFLQIVDKEDFSSLVGKKGNPILALSKNPNSFWVHPHPFLMVLGPQQIRAAKMAILVLLLVVEEGSEGKEFLTKDESGVYNLLVFLWSVEKRWTHAVLVSNPANTKDTNDACAVVARHLKDWRSHQRRQETGDISSGDEERSDYSEGSRMEVKMDPRRKKHARHKKKDDSSDDPAPPKRKEDKRDSRRRPSRPKSIKPRKTLCQ